MDSYKNLVGSRTVTGADRVAVRQPFRGAGDQRGPRLRRSARHPRSTPGQGAEREPGGNATIRATLRFSNGKVSSWSRRSAGAINSYQNQWSVA
jgi:hypothetical protein